MTPKLQRQRIALEREKRKRGMGGSHRPKGFHQFIEKTDPRYRFNWHHEVIAAALDAWVKGAIRNLMLFVPPQHGKSELVSRKLPAYLFGENPDAKVIAASYAAELVQGMNRDVQRLMDSDEYIRLYPATRLNSKNIRTVSGSWLRNNDIFEVIGRRGSYRCAGVGGGITGFPGDYVIIDDPYKDYKEATSPTTRKAVWEWYTSVLLSRTHNDSRKLLTTTRWHHLDLAGELLDKEGDEWTVIRLPAICEDASAPYEQRHEGEALWPERFSVETLEKRRRLNRHQFGALYQQNPTPREGGMFKREWFEVVVGAAPAEAKRIRSWDMAATEDDGDWTVGALMSYAGGIVYIEDIQRFRLGSSARDARILSTARRDAAKYGAGRVKIRGPQDPGAAGKSAGEAFVKMLAGYPAFVEVESGSKEVRADPFASYAGAGNVRLVKEDEKSEPWHAEMVEELAAFPGAHDDIVDACSAGFNWLTLVPETPKPSITSIRL